MHKSFVSLTLRKLVTVALALLPCAAMQAWAEVREIPRSNRPEYVTAWPKQVPVEKPDPVLGDKPFWETWAYSSEFAQRFRGFPIEAAEPELSPGIHALVFRIFKEVIFTGYPEQYRCEYEIYFDSSIEIPLSESPRTPDPNYAKNIPPGYKRLDAIEEMDRKGLLSAKPAPFYVQRWAALLADGPLDGRFTTFGVIYVPHLTPRLAMARLSAGFDCRASAPKRDNSRFWLSLFGKNPYSAGKPGASVHGSYVPSFKGTFDPGAHPEKDGYFRVPEAFYQTVLPKVTLVKTLNSCISKGYIYTLPNKGSPGYWAEIFSVCKNAEQLGLIYGFEPDGSVVRGLNEFGF